MAEKFNLTILDEDNKYRKLFKIGKGFKEYG